VDLACLFEKRQTAALLVAGVGIRIQTLVTTAPVGAGRTAEGSLSSHSVWLGQMFQYGVTGFLGLRERLEWRAADLDRATALMNRAP